MFAKIEDLNNFVLYVEADGKLDIHHAPDYLEEIKEHLSKKPTKELILEFKKITFVASIGLRTILELYRIMQKLNGILILKNVNDEVLFTFQTACFDKFLFIENDSENPEENEQNKPLKYDEIKNEEAIEENSVNYIVETEFKDILKGLNKWYYNVSSIMGCNDGNFEENIIQTLLLDDEQFNEKLKLYEKICKDEYINNWTNQPVPFNKEIQMLFSLLIPKLKEIRSKIQFNSVSLKADNLNSF